VLDIGAISTTGTVSPSLQEFSASCACSLLERRIYLPYSARLTWRSTSTVTVLSFLLLTTRPSTVRSFFAVFSGIVGLPYFGAPAGWPRRVFTRALSRRTRRASWVLSSCPVAFCMRSENCSLCSSTRCACSSWADFSRCSLMVAISAHRPGHELGGDRELGGGQAERLARGRLVDALDLVDHAAGLDLGDPVLHVALALAHAHFDRLLGDRLVREYADPHLAAALDVAADGPAAGLDLAGGDLPGLRGLEPVLAEADEVAAPRQALVAALVHLAVLGSLGLQHD